MDILKVRNILQKNNLDVTEEQVEQLNLYAQLLKEKNKSLNLISRKDIDYIWERHILHSISLLFYLELPDGIKILDIGTGGGLPGIPLKILRPNINIELIDSIQKKTLAVQNFINILKLKNISVICNRVENLQKKYDLCLSRAVSEITNLYKWSEKLFNNTKVRYKVSNKITNEIYETPFLIAYKGGKLDNELKKLKLYSQNLKIDTINISISGINSEILTDKKLIIVKQK